MGSLNNAPSWADQWGSANEPAYDDETEQKSKKQTGGKKMAKAKSVASTGLGKAKAAAAVGAAKVKSGTTTGLNWVKAQCQKKSSK